MDGRRQGHGIGARSVVFQVREGDEWQDVPEEQDLQLKRAFLAGFPTVTYCDSHDIYEADLQRMLRTATRSGEVVELRVPFGWKASEAKNSGSSRPFAEPAPQESKKEGMASFTLAEALAEVSPEPSEGSSTQVSPQPSQRSTSASSTALAPADEEPLMQTTSPLPPQPVSPGRASICQRKTPATAPEDVSRLPALVVGAWQQAGSASRRGSDGDLPGVPPRKGGEAAMDA